MTDSDVIKSISTNYRTAGIVKDAANGIVANPHKYQQHVDCLIKCRMSIVTDQQQSVDFSRIVLENFSETLLGRPLSDEQRHGLFSALSMLSKAYNPEYASINANAYFNFKHDKLTGDEYAQIMVGMLDAYFKDFDINAKVGPAECTVLISLFRSFNQEASFTLAATSVFAQHGADIHAPFMENGDMLQQVACTRDEHALDLVVGMVSLGADPFADAPFIHWDGHPFSDKEVDRVYPSYFAYVEHVHQYKLPSNISPIRASNFAYRKECATKVYEFLKKFLLNKDAINDCNQSLVYHMRKANGI